MTAKELYLYSTNPRALLKRNKDRDVRENLLACLFFNPEKINTTFLSSVKAPGDPILTKFMRSYCKKINLHLENNGFIKEKTIEDLKENSYANLGITKPTIQELKNKACKFSEYESYLMLKPSRQEVTTEMANKLKDLSQEYYKIRNLLTPEGYKEFEPIELIENIKKGENNLVVKSVEEHGRVSMGNWTLYISSYKDQININVTEKVAQVVVVRAIDCSIKDAIDKLDDLLWADVGFGVISWNNFNLKYLPKGFKLDLKFVLLDPNDYVVCVQVPENKMKELHEKCIQYIRKNHTELINEQFYKYSDIPLMVSL